MAYTPELDLHHSCMLRRIAWALGKPMTKAIEDVIEHAVANSDRQKVCGSCKDKSRCESCDFSLPQSESPLRCIIG